jgi:hypothetical protein
LQTLQPEIDRPRCERCGAKMTLARRVPATAFGPDAEFRTFECPKCHHTQIFRHLGLAQRELGAQKRA